MNSLRILDLIAMVEKSLDARIPDRSVRLANFRTIATIVRVFHPNAGVAATFTPDRLFERRGDRSRFASPLELLRRRGDLGSPVAGRVALAGFALEVFESVDDTVVRWAESLGAPEHRYPSLIDTAVLKRAGGRHPERSEGSRIIPTDGPRSGRVRPLACRLGMTTICRLGMTECR